MPSAMDRNDTEMMETETETSAAVQQELSSQNDVAIRDFLTLARQLIDQGKPSQALQAVTFIPNTLFKILFTQIVLENFDILKVFFFFFFLRYL